MGLKINLTGLEVFGYHGVYASERESGQLFVVDLELTLATTAKATGDDIANTVDYGVLAGRVAELVSGEPVDLIETLAERVARLCASYPLVEQVKVTVHKPQAPIPQKFADVSVTVDFPGAGWQPVVWSLGSNQGDSLEYLRYGVRRLAGLAGVEVCQVSQVYQTVPVGCDIPQPDFLNVVALGYSCLPPADLVTAGLGIEVNAGRVRTGVNGPRTLDIDVVSYGNHQLATTEVTLPHPRAAARAFVLAPWLEIAPDALLPGVGRVADLLAKIGDDGVALRPELTVEVP